MTLATSPSWWILIALCVTACAVAYGAYARPVVALTAKQRRMLIFLRLTALLAIIVFLLRPVSTEPATVSGDVVAVLIDSSQSMQVADVSRRRRIEEAAAIVRDAIVPGLDAVFDVEVLAFSDGLRPTELDDLEPEAARTDLAGALDAVRERYRDRPLAGVVVLSDGGDTSGRDLVSSAAALGRPVFTIGLGAPAVALDLEVVSVTAGAAAVAESVVDVVATVVSHGREDEPMDVRLEEDGQLLDVQRVVPSGDGAPRRVVFQVSPRHDAATLYTVEIVAAERESITENNRQSVLVSPPGRARRILMVEGAPGYEHSFLKRVWLADTGIELDSVVRKGQNELGEHTFYIQANPARSRGLATGFPVDRASLFRYDAVLLANVEAQSLRPDQLSMTAEFVERRGGGLLLLGSLSLTGDGLRGSPLEELVPLALSDRRSQEFGASEDRADRPLLTDDGAVHPVSQLGATVSETRDRWATLPRLGGSVSLGAARPGASVLARIAAPGGDLRPLLAVQRYGRGRSMVFAGEGSWRWKMMLPADDGRYDRVWGQVARWLTGAASDPVAVSVTGGRTVGERVRLDLHVRDDEHRPVLGARNDIRIRTPGGDVEPLHAELVDPTTGHYVTDYLPRESGVYRIEVTSRTDGDLLGSARDWVLVGGIDAEWADPRLNEPVLARLAGATGGRLLPVTAARTVSELLRETRATHAPPVSRDLWHGVWNFLLLVAVLTTEWSLRRAWGLR